MAQLQKNQIHTVTVTGYTAEGLGVARAEGQVVFIHGGVRGEECAVRILKVLKNVAYGRVEEILTRSPARREPDCPHYPACGGCDFRHVSYEEELEAKRQRVEDALRRIVEEGHTLGMHSYTHDYDQIYESVESFAEDFERVRDYLYEVTGVESTVYRFPGGSSNAVSHIDMREFAEYLDSQEIRFFDWNISSGDGGSFLVPVEMLIENCTATIKDHGTSVVLMHDGTAKSTTLEALPEIIETIQAMEDTVLLPITDETSVVQHIQWKSEGQEASDYNR